MFVEVEVPDFGEDVTEAEVSFWYFDTGEKVKEGEPLLEIHTEKVSAVIECPASGVLKEILAPEGAKVKVGQVIGFIEEE